MAIQGPFKVGCADVFPHGVGIVGAVIPLVDFDRSTKENKVQQLDKESHIPVWTVDVMDFDPETRELAPRHQRARQDADEPPSAPRGL